MTIDLSPMLQPEEAIRHFDKYLRFLESQAMEAWRESRGEQTIERTVRGQDGSFRTIVTKRRGFGEVRYLTAAMRLAREQFDAAIRLAKFRRDLTKPATQSIENSAPTPCARPSMIQDEAPTTPAEPEIASPSQNKTYDDDFFGESVLPAPQNDSDTPVRARKLRRQRERELRRTSRKAK